MANQKIEGEPANFSWLSQLRMYWEDIEGAGDSGSGSSHSAMIRMMNAQARHVVITLGAVVRLRRISPSSATIKVMLRPVSQSARALTHLTLALTLHSYCLRLKLPLIWLVKFWQSHRWSTATSTWAVPCAWS
jgi:hypothetical protein